MKSISFFAKEPATSPKGSYAYRLETKQRYDLHSDPPAYGSLGAMTYLVDGASAALGADHHFPVDDALQFSRPGAGPGRGGVMRLLLIKRADGMTRSQFARHWRTIHAPLAIRMNPSFDHYVTNIVLDPTSEWDGILQEWFADEAIFDRHEQGLAEHKRVVAEDIPLFVKSVARSPQFLARAT